MLGVIEKIRQPRLQNTVARCAKTFNAVLLTCCLAGGVKAHHQYPHLLLGEQAVKDFRKEQTHLGEI